MDECKRSGQIPAFGNWEQANELPITQYFECARQAGLIRYSNSSGECDPYMHGDLYAVDFKKHSRTVAHPPRKTIGREKRCPQVKDQKKQGKVCDVTEPPSKLHHHPMSHANHKHKLHQNDAVPRPPRPRLPTRRLPKPVDEDLYKIPPELLHTSKRKKMLGFFSRCLLPACVA